MNIKRMSLFSKIYLAVVSFFLIALVLVGGVLWFYLSAFEASRPNTTAEKVFTQYFKSGNIGSLVKQFSAEHLKFEYEESINREFKEQYDLTKLNYFAVESKEKNKEQYTVSYNNMKLADFVLIKNKNIGFGMKDYILEDVNFSLKKSDAVTVLVNKGYKLKLNGINVDKSYITETDIQDASYKHMPKDVEGILYDKYVVSEILFEPEISVIGFDGVEQKAVYDEGLKCNIVPKTYNEVLQHEHSEYVINAMKEYARFLSNKGSFSYVAPFLDSKSRLYTNIRDVSVSWLWKHKEHKISEEKAENFYKYTDDVFSCSVYLKNTLINYSNEEHIEYIDVTLYLRYVNGQYLIYDMVNND